MASGFSALAAALVVGARKDYGRQALLPHNGVYVLIGAGLLWFGWFGFNGGSGFSTGNASVLAFTNTLLTPACSLLMWFVLDLIRGRKVTAIGAATAIIVGCVLITPAGGFIAPGWAMLLGAVGALPCYAVIVLRPRTRVDETLDVLAAHGIAGLTGILFIGFFAQLAWNDVADGLLYGNAAQLGDQVLAALAAPAYAFGVTYLLLRVIGAVMPLRASERDETLGMDVVQHGEEAYSTGGGHPGHAGGRGRGRGPGQAHLAARRGRSAVVRLRALPAFSVMSDGRWRRESGSFDGIQSPTARTAGRRLRSTSSPDDGDAETEGYGGDTEERGGRRSRRGADGRRGAGAPEGRRARPAGGR